MKKLDVVLLIITKLCEEITFKLTTKATATFITDGEESVSSFYALSTKYSVPQNYNYEI